MVSDRPIVLKVDDRNRPHCEDGPFCEWSDGSALYSWHGVRVPWDVIDRPESITVARIDREENAEVRRVMIERMGYERYTLESGAKAIHSDDFGVLYRKDFPDGDYLLTVHVINSTPEPDGTKKRYVLSVNRELRPMRRTKNGVEYGEPQQLTARNAVASTFFKRGEQYNPAYQS